ncbi:MAG: hypothetical protein ACJ8AT_35360 [Hyalangium sp.]|uniref:hypothetical protein n=1 Tax=Hyalangium sp. TaxID=2028555 RepID=UPI00389AF7ED
MSSLLLTSLILGVACGPNAEQGASDEGSAPVVADASGEATGPNNPDDSAELAAAVGPEEGSAELLTQSDELTSTPVTAQATGLRSVADWEKLFLSRWSADHASFLPMSTSNDSWQYYNLAYGIDGNTAMYRATGKTQYLDRALLYVNNMVASARPSSTLGSNFHDSYLSWKSKRAEVINQEVALYESYCWRYVTTLLRVIHDTPALYNNANYRAQYQKLLDFSEKNIFEKWFKRGANAYIYRVNTHMASHWALIALNLSRLTTDATRKANYLAVLNNVNQHLPNYKSSLRQQMGTSPINSAAYFWSDTWASHARPGQDVSHGNGVMAFVVESHDLGVEWTDADMHKFVATLNNVIWKAAGKYGNYVDGSGAGNGWFNDGLVKLGRYDANLQRRLETHTVGQNTQLYGNGALNARILLGAAAK